MSMTTAARASTIFTDQGAWEAAAPGPVSVEDFESAPLGLLPLGDWSTDLGLVDVTLFGTINTTVGIVEPGLVNGSREFEGSIQNNPGVNQISAVRFSFPAPVRAWGADFLSTASGDFLVVTANGSTYFFDDELGFPGDGFLGSVEDTEFDYVTFTTENPTSFGEFFKMDDLRFAVPEPSTSLLLAAGLGALAIRRRRKVPTFLRKVAASCSVPSLFFSVAALGGRIGTGCPSALGAGRPSKEGNPMRKDIRLASCVSVPRTPANRRKREHRLAQGEREAARTRHSTRRTMVTMVALGGVLTFTSEASASLTYDSSSTLSVQFDILPPMVLTTPGGTASVNAGAGGPVGLAGGDFMGSALITLPPTLAPPLTALSLINGGSGSSARSTPTWAVSLCW
jgi:hypothetical protein